MVNEAVLYTKQQVQRQQRKKIPKIGYYHCFFWGVVKTAKKMGLITCVVHIVIIDYNKPAVYNKKRPRRKNQKKKRREEKKSWLGYANDTHTHMSTSIFFAANSGKTKVFSIQNDDDDGLVITLIFAKQKTLSFQKKNHQLEHCREIISSSSE